MWCLLGEPGRHLVGAAAEVEDALPLIRRALVTVMLLTFIGLWNEFLWPFLRQRRHPARQHMRRLCGPCSS
jgi:hypothetical protein